MQTSYIDLIVNSLLKKVGKVITNKEIESLQKQLLGSDHNENKLYKLIYTLKNRGYLLELKSGLFVISYPEAKLTTPEEIKDNYYRPVLFDILKNDYKNLYCIGGKKGLELHLNNYEIPEDIEVFSNCVNKKQTIIHGANLSIKSMSYQHPRKSSKQIEKLIREKTNKIVLSGKPFTVGCIELCLLETLYYSPKSSSGYEMELVKKALKKFKSKIDTDFIKLIIQSGKHNASLNRLYELSKHIDTTMSNQLFGVIKSDGFRVSV